MTAIRDIEDAYIRRLTEMKDPLEQFDYLMALGMKMGRAVSVEKDEFRIPGCRTAIWVRREGSSFTASSDSMIVLGVLWILRDMYDGRSREEISANPMRFIDLISDYVLYPEIKKNGTKQVYLVLSSEKGE